MSHGIGHLLNQTMDVYTITETQSATGGKVETETLRIDDEPCLLEVARGIERTILGREGTVVSHWIFSAVKTMVAKDRIKIGSRIFDISGHPDDVQLRDHHMEIPVVERL